MWDEGVGWGCGMGVRGEGVMCGVRVWGGDVGWGTR